MQPSLASAGKSCIAEGSATADPGAILASLDLVVYDWDLASDRLTWGPNARTTLACLPEDGLENGSDYSRFVTSDSDESRHQAVHGILAVDEGSGVPYRTVYRLASPDGTRVEVEDLGRCFAGETGKPARAHGFVRILSRSRNNGSDASGASEVFGSRSQFKAWIDARCEQIGSVDSPFAVLMLGIVDLPTVNRRHGYDAGDEVIHAAGRRVARSLRSGDRVIRYAGGKLAIVVGLTAIDQVETAAKRIVRLINSSEFETSAGPVRVEARVGSAIAQRHGRSANLLLQRAEEAFEAAETANKSIAVYALDDTRQERLRRDRDISDLIVSALNERRVVLAFQPIRAVQPNGRAFEEALMRIRRDDGSLIYPDSIIPFAERLGLIEVIDQRVFELTLEALTVSPNRFVSMNVSSVSLRSEDFLTALEAQLGRRRALAERLTFEIVETQAIDDVEATSESLKRIKALGVRVAMDDFGSGHSSFRNLRRLGIDLVKIDGAFVQNLARSVDDRFFVRTLASLARHLNIETVAEWVEDDEAMALLTEWGVDYLQGYAVGRPELGPELAVAVNG